MKTGRPYLTLVLISMVGVLIVIISMFVVLLLLFITKEWNENETQSYEYQLYTLNTETNEAHFGWVNMEEYLDFDEYRSYDDGNGNYNLISNFEIDTYICTGSCYCDNEFRRTAVSVPVASGLVFLVAAISSVLAYNKAKSYFDNECEKELDSCPRHLVRAEVVECDESGKCILDPQEVINCDDSGKCEKNRPQTEGEEEVHQSFMCSGICLTKGFSKTIESELMAQGISQPSTVWNTRASSFQCFDRTLNQEVIRSDCVSNARKIFNNRILHQFCEKLSQVEFMPGSKKMPVCTGINEEGKNPAVRCRKIGPDEIRTIKNKK